MPNETTISTAEYRVELAPHLGSKTRGLAVYHLMEKLDSLTPWHSLRKYETAQEAIFQAYQYAKGRKAGALYPQYSVNGRTF